VQIVTDKSVAVRHVAAGLRVKYIGKLADRNGAVTTYEEPDHKDCRLKTYAEINSDPYSSLSRVGSEEWDGAVCNSGPVTPQEVEFFNDDSYPIGTACCILFAGVPGDMYEWEIYEHIEYIGTLVVNKNPSHADAAMAGKVVQTTKTLAANKPLEPSMLSKAWSMFKGLVSDNLPSIAETALGVGALLTRNPQGGAMVAHGLTGIAQNSILPLLNGGTPQHNNNPRMTQRQLSIMA
jgi:hypothetical protein